MIDRIKKVMEYKQMSPTAFADTIDINRSSLTHIFSGRNQPSLDVAKKILVAFPEISTDWLILGSGKMLQYGSPLDVSPHSSSIDPPSYNMPQADLFSSLSVDSPSSDVSQSVVSSNEHDVVISPVPDPFPATSSRSKISDAHISSKDTKRTRLSNSQSDKKISKIIFFYEDKSFEVYVPN